MERFAPEKTEMITAMKINRRSLLAFGFALAGLAPALAQTGVGARRRPPGAYGNWRSNSGNIFEVPARREAFDIIITQPNGIRQIGLGSWVEYPRRFTYTVAGVKGSCVATFDPENPNKIRVEGPSGTNYWTRVSN